MEHDKAVALAEKHGVQVAKGEHDFGVFPQSLVAMFAEYREELAQRSGVMPKSQRRHVGSGKYLHFCDPDEVREAIASLEARLEQAERKRKETLAVGELVVSQLQQSEARVRELEKENNLASSVLLALSGFRGNGVLPMDVEDALDAMDAAINKESGK